MKTQIYFVLGPTASGISKFALSLAKKLNGEIINADSMQIYKELSILTARPTIHDQKKINHHLYGFVKGDIRFNVQKWCEEASTKINYLVDKNSLTILGKGNKERLVEEIAFITREIVKEGLDMLSKYLGTATAAIIPKMTITMINSINVKPLRDLVCFMIFPFFLIIKFLQFI